MDNCASYFHIYMIHILIWYFFVKSTTKFKCKIKSKSLLKYCTFYILCKFLLQFLCFAFSENYSMCKLIQKLDMNCAFKEALDKKRSEKDDILYISIYPLPPSPIVTTGKVTNHNNQKCVHYIFGTYLSHFNSDYSGIKRKCELNILRPDVKKIANILKISWVIAIFVRLTKLPRIFENIFFSKKRILK